MKDLATIVGKTVEEIDLDKLLDHLECSFHLVVSPDEACPAGYNPDRCKIFVDSEGKIEGVQAS